MPVLTTQHSVWEALAVLPGLYSASCAAWQWGLPLGTGPLLGAVDGMVKAAVQLLLAASCSLRADQLRTQSVRQPQSKLSFRQKKSIAEQSIIELYPYR